MTLFSMILLGLAMATDAFAAALGKGAAMTRPTLLQALRIGLIFGVVEAITPVVGWLLGTAASRHVEAWDHWVAFALLGGLGVHMIYKALTETGERDDGSSANTSLFVVALAGLATSIDALAAGVGLAFVDVSIAAMALLIGLCTFAMVTVGVMAGRLFGAMIGKGAEVAGGIILIGVGAWILLDHLAVLGS